MPEARHITLDALIRAHRPDVLRTARHVLGDASAAEDIAQEVFLKLQLGMPEFRGDADLGTWLYRVTVNQCRDVLRRRAPRWMERSPAEIAAATGLGAPEGPDIYDQRLESERVKSLVYEAIERLPAEQRRAVVLRYINDLSYDEIASATGVPRGTAASRVFRALAKLGEDLNSPELELMP